MCYQNKLVIKCVIKVVFQEIASQNLYSGISTPVGLSAKGS